MTTTHEAMILTDETTGIVARWRWITAGGHPAPRIELFPTVEAMLDPDTAPTADLCAYDHETGTHEPFTRSHFAARVAAALEPTEEVL